jgi:flagellar hook-length control protein FliK
LLKVDGIDKAAKGEDVKGKTLLNKSLLQETKAHISAEKAGEKLVDDTEKLQKHAAAGLGIFQQETREPMMNKLGETEVRAGIAVGSEGKNSKSTEDAAKSPRVVADIQDLMGKKDVAIGKNKEEIGHNSTGKTVAEALVSKGEAVEITSTKQDAQGRFSLKGAGELDDGIDVSKLIKRDGLAAAKSQTKSDAVDISKSQVKAQEASAKVLSQASAANDVKAALQDDANKRQMIDSGIAQAKQAKEGQLQQGLETAEKASKVKSSFKAVAANRSGIAGVQAQAPASQASTVQPEIVMASASGQDANMAGDDRGTGRSAAELLMTDGSIRDVRNARSDFAMQMAYRSAASFKPSDAMLEISKAANNGSMKLELMLEPATLGKIQVSIQTDAQKQIQVHLMVDQQTSRQVLEQQLPQLRQALADQGLNLSGFTMDMNSQQQNDGKSSHDTAGMGHMGVNGEAVNIMSLGDSVRMGVNMADDGSLSILA